MSDTMTEPDLETVVSEEPAIPCRIQPPSSSTVCGHDGEHLADVQVLSSCGCVFAYCDSAVKWLGIGTVTCEGHRPARAFVIIAVEPLR